MPPAQGRKPPGVGLLCEKVFRAGERSGGAVPRGRTLLWALRFLPLRQARGLSPQGHCLPPRGMWGQPGWGGHQGQVQRLWPEGQCCISIKAKHAPAWPIPDGRLPRPAGFLLLSAPTLATLGRIYFLLNVRGEKPHTTGPEPGGHGSASGLKFRHLCFHTHWAWHTRQVR